MIGGGLDDFGMGSTGHAMAEMRTRRGRGAGNVPGASARGNILAVGNPAGRSAGDVLYCVRVGSAYCGRSFVAFFLFQQKGNLELGVIGSGQWSGSR